jgi:hypothetical protein
MCARNWRACAPCNTAPAKCIEADSDYLSSPWLSLTRIHRQSSDGLHVRRLLAHEATAPKLLHAKWVPLRFGVLGVELLLDIRIADHGDDDLSD